MTSLSRFINDYGLYVLVGIGIAVMLYCLVRAVARLFRNNKKEKYNG